MQVLNAIKEKVKTILEGRDPAHDFQHIMRVYRNAQIIGKREGAEMDVLLTAALLHDLVVYPKGSAKRSKSADDSADMAEEMLKSYGYDNDKIDKISYCIRTHSYSKRLVPSSIEGKILQDADRLDAIGAIGIARTFSVGGLEKRLFYDPKDPFCKTRRQPDDMKYTLDHFRAKLLKLQKTLHTRTAKKMAKERTDFMVKFLRQMEKEIRQSRPA